MAASAASSAVIAAKLNRTPARGGVLIFTFVLIAGIVFIGYSLSRDLADLTLGSALPYILLGTALFVALGFEFETDFTIPPTPWRR